MSVIVSGTVPADEFALHYVLGALPETRFEVERIIECGEDAVMPLVWIRGDDRESIESALSGDPSVQDVSLLAAFDEEFLFRMEWLERVDLVLQMLTTPGATVLDAFGCNGKWRLRLLFPEHEMFSRTHDYCERHGLTFEIESIRQFDSAPAGRYELTEEQYRTLVLAVECGYFSVPREITLEELADEVDVSHQALSERLRRGTQALIEDTLMIGGGSIPKRAGVSASTD